MEVKENISVATGDFWYDLFDGGYIRPEELLKDKEDIDAVLNAIEVLREFEESLQDVIEEI